MEKFAAFSPAFLSSFVQQNLTDMMSTEVEIPGKFGHKRNLIVVAEKGFPLLETFSIPGNMNVILEKKWRKTMSYLLPDTEDNLVLNLSDLISLRDAPMSEGDIAMRDLDRENLERLQCSDPESWPTILVTRCTAGYLLLMDIIDGKWQ